jgi:hypothetical protein
MALTGKAGGNVALLVRAMSQHLPRMSNTLTPAPLRATGANWWVRPDGLGARPIQNGTSYANAWGRFVDIAWASIDPGDKLWVCGTFFNDTLFVLSTSGAKQGTLVNPIEIRLDYATDPGIIYACRKVLTTEWIGPNGNNEYYLPDMESPHLMIFENRSRIIGPGTTSRQRARILTTDLATNKVTMIRERPIFTGMETIIPKDGKILPAPLERYTKYWLINTGILPVDNEAQFATSLANAMAGIAINLTSAPTGNWFIFLSRPDTHQDPVPGSLTPGTYSWDGINKRVYYRPTADDLSNQDVHISFDRNITDGACIYLDGMTHWHIHGGGEYGGLFGKAPKGILGMSHLNAVYALNCTAIKVDGVKIAGCRSGVLINGGSGHISRNNEISDAGHHGTGGEGVTTSEPALISERNYIHDVAQKHDFGDGQGSVLNPLSANSVHRRNFLQRVGRNHDFLNNGCIVFDSSMGVNAYRNLLDDCIGECFEIGSGPDGAIDDAKVYSNIVTRHNRRLSYANDTRTRNAWMFMQCAGGNDNIQNVSARGNLVCNSRFQQDSRVVGIENYGLVNLRIANSTATLNAIDIRFNAFANIESGKMYVINKMAGTTTAPTPVFTADFNLYSSITELYASTVGPVNYTPAQLATYKTATGNDVNTVYLPGTGAVSWEPPSREMIEFIRQDDEYDTLSDPVMTLNPFLQDIELVGAGLPMPSALPQWHIEPHETEVRSPFVPIPMAAGHQRQRRVTTGHTRTMNVSMVLTKAQYDVFVDWYEHTLRAGEYHFVAHVHKLGIGLEWRDAFIVEKQETAMPRGHWRIEMTLYMPGTAGNEPL